MVHIMRVCLKEKLDDTRGVTRIRKSNRDSQNNEWPKRKRLKGKIMIYTIPHRKE